MKFGRRDQIPTFLWRWNHVDFKNGFADPQHNFEITCLCLSYVGCAFGISQQQKHLKKIKKTNVTFYDSISGLKFYQFLKILSHQSNLQNFSCLVHLFKLEHLLVILS